MFYQGQKIGKYKVLDVLGAGGFGIVYLAEDQMINKKVAIKVPHKQDATVEKLLKEPRLLAALDHPNIVKVLTADTTAKVFYIVMEYVPGNSLEAYLKKHKPIPFETALPWFLQLCDALAYAHSKKLIHRDVRPANVLMAPNNQVKLTDFGTSRYLVDQPWASTRIGSPPYMAPEHYKGKATSQSDIYSMGILMYECLTGDLPYFDAKPANIIRMAMKKDVRLPHELALGVPENLSKVIMKAMHPSPPLRYTSFTDLYRALEKISNPKPKIHSQELAYLLKDDRKPSREHSRSATVHFSSPPQRRGSTSNPLCWSCGRPVSPRSQTCPHCHVELK
jgi:serine/threonine-protein kinase